MKHIGFFCMLLLCLYACRSANTGQAAVKQHGSRFVLQLGNQQMEIDPSAGGRITALLLNGENFLTGPEVNDFNWGSSFWPSPQQVWRWPPSAELDNKPYTVIPGKGSLRMVSLPDPKTGLVVTKEFSAVKKPAQYILRYTITNKSAQPQPVAPWEVTRVHTGGLSFFPRGAGDMWGGLLPSASVINGIAWYQYDIHKLPVKGDRQLYSDGSEGWMAHINNNTILVKKFPDVPFEKQAPKEGEVELFASEVAPGKSYVEIEQQGSYELLEPGASLTWEVRWWLRALPAGIRPGAGNDSLVLYVKDLIK